MTTQKLDFDYEITKSPDSWDFILKVNGKEPSNERRFFLDKLKQLCQEIDSHNYKHEKYQESVGNAFHEIYARLSNLEQQEAQNNLLLTMIDNQLNKMLQKLDELDKVITNANAKT